MTTNTPQVGNLGTISFASTGFTAYWQQIGAWQPKLAKIEVSHLLTTTYKEFVFDSLADPGSVALKLFYDARQTQPTLGLLEIITITFPETKGYSGSTRAKVTGSGALSQIGTPAMEIGKLMEQDFVLDWDGFTGPTYSVESSGTSTTTTTTTTAA